MAINVSARQFHQPDFVPYLVDLISYTGVNPRQLKLELNKDIESLGTKLRVINLCMMPVAVTLAALALSLGVNPRQLKLELTETLLVDDIEETTAKMIKLKQLGVGFALDDFGTGYSSLSYLKRMPLDQLKIDQSFVRDLMTDPNDAAIALAVITLGHSLGLAVIAEGVETQAQHDYLHGQGCDAYQGYLLGRPMPLENFEQYVLSR